MKKRKESIVGEAEALMGEKNHWLPTVSFYLRLDCQLMWKCGFQWQSVDGGSDTKMLGVALRSTVVQLRLGQVHDAEQ